MIERIRTGSKKKRASKEMNPLLEDEDSRTYVKIHISTEDVSEFSSTSTPAKPISKAMSEPPRKTKDTKEKSANMVAAKIIDEESEEETRPRTRSAIKKEMENNNIKKPTKKESKKPEKKASVADSTKDSKQKKPLADRSTSRNKKQDLSEESDAASSSDPSEDEVKSKKSNAKKVTRKAKVQPKKGQTAANKKTKKAKKSKKSGSDDDDYRIDEESDESSYAVSLASERSTGENMRDEEDDRPKKKQRNTKKRKTKADSDDEEAPKRARKAGAKDTSNFFTQKIVQKKDAYPKYFDDQKNAKAKKKKGKKDAEAESEANNDELFIPEGEQTFDISKAFVPWWTKEEFIRDKELRRPEDLDYDPTTIHIPDEEYKKLTPFMKQYWHAKAENMDKLVGIRFGRWYVFYYQDAIILHKVLDFRIHVSEDSTTFYIGDSTFYKYCDKVWEAGYIFMLLDQMEQFKDKAEDQHIMKREVTQVITRGTYTEKRSHTYHSQYIMTIVEKPEANHFGVALVDTTTHEIFLGEIEDDDSKINMRTLATRAKPFEIVYFKNSLSNEAMEILKNLSVKPTMIRSKRKGLELPHVIVEKLRKYFEELEDSKSKGGDIGFPALIQNMIRSYNRKSGRGLKVIEDFNLQACAGRDCFWSFQALLLAIEYLETVLIADLIIPTSNYMEIEIQKERFNNLYIDSQALDTLEIFEISYMNSYTEENTLFSYMDHTVSHFGKRMLKKWLANPSKDVEQLSERLDAVEDLSKNMDLVTQFQKEIAKLPDVERKISAIYNLRNKKKYAAHHHDEAALEQLNAFVDFLKQLKNVEDIIDLFGKHIGKFKSSRLKRLVTKRNVEQQKPKKSKKKDSKETMVEEEEEEGLFPKIAKIVQDLQDMMTTEENFPTPTRGLNKECDDIIDSFKKIKKDLETHLQDIRKKFDCDKIKYHHTGKLKYQIEIPEHLVSGTKKPKDYTVTSKREGYHRFHTDFIEESLAKFAMLEKAFRRSLIPFIFDYVKKFYEYHDVWNQVIHCLSELDCLCSLAILAKKMPMCCRPKLIASDEPIFRLMQMTHPCISDKKPDFVRNDVIFDEKKEIMLITGPNMGGKSTILRQACIAIIMAQVGSFVPAKEFELSPFDRVFTRIGATDRLMEKKSTFFVELEETLQIVREATRKSFVIIDELGRGTSTYDGIAIAYSVLKYLVESTRCLTMFTTHYHLIVDEFSEEKSIQNFYMDYEYDSAKEELKFLYKFVKGSSPSFGINAAKLAGVPTEVIDTAKVRAEQMKEEKRNVYSQAYIQNNFMKSINNLIKLCE